MKHVHFIYGNQTFEIDEEVTRLIQATFGEEIIKEAIYHFDVADFFSRDSSENRKLLDQFQNTCETVSFFAPTIFVHLKNLQKLRPPKQNIERITEDLEQIHLVRAELDGQMVWFDADTLVEKQDTRHHIIGKQIVSQLTVIDKNTLYMELDPSWQERTIYQRSGDEAEAVDIRNFLRTKLKKEIMLSHEFGSPSVQSANTNELYALITYYLHHPPSQVELVMSANIRKTSEIDSKLFDLLSRNAHLIKKTVSYDDFRPLRWIVDRARSKGLEIDSTSADLLIEIAGNEFAVLDSELEKLAVLYGENAALKPEDLIRGVSHSKSFTIFRIADYLSKKDLKNSLECLEQLLGTHSVEPVNIFGLIASQFRRLLKIVWLQNQAMPEKQIVSTLKLNAWIARQLIQQIESFTERELENIVIHLAKCDIALKYSKDARIVLKNMCYLICMNEFRSQRYLERKWLP